MRGEGRWCGYSLMKPVYCVMEWQNYANWKGYIFLFWLWSTVTFKFETYVSFVLFCVWYFHKCWYLMHDNIIVVSDTQNDCFSDCSAISTLNLKIGIYDWFFHIILWINSWIMWIWKLMPYFLYFFAHGLQSCVIMFNYLSSFLEFFPDSWVPISATNQALVLYCIL